MSLETKRQIAEQLFNDTSAYADIMALPHHVSSRHPAMPQGDRAAQFAPFAALPFEAMAKCRRNLRAVCAVIATKPRVDLTVFAPETGESRTIRVRLKAANETQLTLLDGQVILVENLQAIQLLKNNH
ncbi:hypothetical protein ACS4N0_04275 [Levilactobacillus zymae]|uniref:hypothetical protein n=1 Tax=Levilactobacillus zymae TaxID=267363 RepID=UPI003FCE5C99